MATFVLYYNQDKGKANNKGEITMKHTVTELYRTNEKGYYTEDYIKANGIKEYRKVMHLISKDAVKLLNDHGINCSWDVITDMIINRKGNGPCPMEKAVCELGDDEIELGYNKILQTLNELRAQSK